MELLTLAPILVVTAFKSVGGSSGDESSVHRRCLRGCLQSECWTKDGLDAFQSKQPLPLRWLGWNCEAECDYGCMWRTVESTARLQQFHGKWPFVRLLGIQEPASAFFSLLNLAANFVCLRTFVSVVPNEGPMFAAWLQYAFVSINSWIWSTIFHTRDVDWTEKLDYFCAFSVVVVDFLTFLRRLCYGDGRRRWSRTATIFCSGLFVSHVYTMWFVKFDYGYNMKVAVSLGIFSSFCRLVWCYRCYATGVRHVKWAALSILCVGLSMSLELLEFEPWFHTIDSHALWHLSTVPIHFLTYRFAAEDCRYLKRERDECQLP